MNGETTNERRTRENAERLAEHKRSTARPSVPTRDDIILPTFDSYAAREQENNDRVTAARRADASKFLQLKLGRTPTEAEITSVLERCGFREV